MSVYNRTLWAIKCFYHDEKTGLLVNPVNGFIWPSSNWVEATCEKHSDPPVADCTCGIIGSLDPNLLLQEIEYPWLFGILRVQGKAFEDKEAKIIRSHYMSLRTILLSKGFPIKKRRELAIAYGRRYRPMTLWIHELSNKLIYAEQFSVHNQEVRDYHEILEDDREYQLILHEGVLPDLYHLHQ